MTQTTRSYDKLSFVASDVPEARQALDRLIRIYGNVRPDLADAIIALGGDGLMLQTLHAYMGSNIPIYGMNRGSVGFLMNEYRENDLKERLQKAQISAMHPLAMSTVNQQGEHHEGLAINEVSLFRQTHQAAKIRISIDGQVRMEELICDGILVATPAGSTAYNLSAQGPILPINAPLLALTPISAFRPRRWRGALLREEAIIRFDILEATKRPVSAVADNFETRNIVKVEIKQAKQFELLMMFDPDHSLDERILWEQFRY